MPGFRPVKITKSPCSRLCFALVLILWALLSVGCAANRGPQTSSALQAELESSRAIARQEPFVTRVFDPHLEGRWIGQAVAYGCYREGQAPGERGPSKEEILEDLLIISNHWNLIRVYNADDDTERILQVIREHRLPIRMMLGIWLETETNRPEARASNIRNVLRGISLANEYSDIVTAVSVGNETLVFWSWHKMEQEQLTRYIRFVRKHSSVPVTTADDYNYWNKPPSLALAEELDFIMVHAYPLWNGLALDTAIPWLDETLANVAALHPTRTMVLGEIGWATNYDPTKTGDGQQGTLVKGEVGIEAQAAFLSKLDAWIKATQMTTFLFEAFDEPWKGGGAASGPDEIEKHWGVFYEDRNPKESFLMYLNQRKQVPARREQ